ncbi:hypothetical protein HYH03_003899 [Edaphochlamys debaryana]|uniref:Uncharacterized protein n=1 Tax=Edaphochlamys debaryana TaxID=47281 RepID=A0A835YC67_9CHLO|nr:hypothetical protein HYH03_003899 [Edaphochlamys debaryana]|eukprot:KAG2498141.1 hypothetical protein HYH03_003899 [Edaphochlamys debaryana]
METQRGPSLPRCTPGWYCPLIQGQENDDCAFSGWLDFRSLDGAVDPQAAAVPTGCIGSPYYDEAYGYCVDQPSLNDVPAILYSSATYCKSLTPGSSDTGYFAGQLPDPALMHPICWWCPASANPCNLSSPPPSPVPPSPRPSPPSLPVLRNCSTYANANASCAAAFGTGWVAAAPWSMDDIQAMTGWLNSYTNDLPRYYNTSSSSFYCSTAGPVNAANNPGAERWAFWTDLRQAVNGTVRPSGRWQSVRVPNGCYLPGYNQSFGWCSGDARVASPVSTTAVYLRQNDNLCPDGGLEDFSNTINARLPVLCWRCPTTIPAICAPPPMSPPPRPPPMPPRATPDSCGEGFLFITTDDADDVGHCEGSACGMLYSSSITYAMMRVRSASTMRGILLVTGSATGTAATTFAGWRDVACRLDPRVCYQGVTTVTTGDQLLGTDITRFKLVFISSDWCATRGGITQDLGNALQLMASEFRWYLNYANGSVIALAQTCLNEPYSFLPSHLSVSNDYFPDVSFLSSAEPLGSLADDTNNDHCCFHSRINSPDGWNGLQPLAYKTGACPVPWTYFNTTTQQWVLQECQATHLVSYATCLLPKTEDCNNGIDDNGDGLVDHDDPHCWRCGNFFLEGDEECDDGNQLPYDGCDAFCRIETGSAPPPRPRMVLSPSPPLPPNNRVLCKGVGAAMVTTLPLDGPTSGCTTPGSTCRQMMVGILSYMLNRNASLPLSILALIPGDPGSAARDAFATWVLDLPAPLDIISVTFLQDADAVGSAIFTDARLIYIPSAQTEAGGGLTDAMNAELSTRMTDLDAFVTQYGGSLITLSQRGLQNPFEFLGLAVGSRPDGAGNLTTGLELSSVSGVNITNATLPGSALQVFTGPSQWSGLTPIVTVSNKCPQALPSYFLDTYYGVDQSCEAVLLFTDTGCIRRGLEANCTDGVDNDGNGMTDFRDPGCRRCGDGVQDGIDGEECDDGNMVDGDLCNNYCQQSRPSEPRTTFAIATLPSTSAATSSFPSTSFALASFAKALASEP